MKHIKELLSFLEKVPLHLRVGPWSNVALIYLCSFFVYLLATLQSAASSYDAIIEPEVSDTAKTVRLLSAIWGIIITACIVFGSGWWPLMSYTLTSWNLLWLRNLFCVLSSYGYQSAAYWARLFKFPALVGCTITVTVWWIVLVPLINHLMEDKYRDGFWKFNLSFILLNIHFLNLPMAAIEFYYSESKLVFFDLWVALAICFAYILFYLNVLDPRGLHFYIVFTPRTYLCFIPYTIVLLIYYGCYIGWNALL